MKFFALITVFITLFSQAKGTDRLSDAIRDLDVDGVKAELAHQVLSVERREILLKDIRNVIEKYTKIKSVRKSPVDLLKLLGGVSFGALSVVGIYAGVASWFKTEEEWKQNWADPKKGQVYRNSGYKEDSKSLEQLRQRGMNVALLSFAAGIYGSWLLYKGLILEAARSYLKNAQIIERLLQATPTQTN